MCAEKHLSESGGGGFTYSLDSEVASDGVPQLLLSAKGLVCDKKHAAFCNDERPGLVALS